MKLLVVTLILLLLLLPIAPEAPAAPQQSGAGAASRKKPAAPKKRSKPPVKSALTPQAQQVQQTLATSADLRPLAAVLMSQRSPVNYAAVEGFAREHENDSAGALAWLAIGYARILDEQFAQAIPALQAARPQSAEVGDYVDYLLASAARSAGNHVLAASTLRDLASRYPDSLLLREAAMIQASSLLASGQTGEAIRALESRREPARAEVELALARSYLAANRTASALEAFRRVYYRFPRSAEAKAAEQELEKLVRGQRVPPPALELRLQRADLLLQAQQNKEAAEEYHDLVEELPERRDLKVALASALFRLKRYGAARDLLEKMPVVADETNAQRLYYLTEITRSRDGKRYRQYLSALRENAGKSAWLQEALLQAGNSRLLLEDYDGAARFYLEAAHRVPDGKRASYALWKAAWLRYRLNQTSEAKKLIEEHIRLYPSSAEISSALYWRGRLAEADKEIDRARAYYQTLSDRFRNYYYAELARERLKEIKIDGNAPLEPMLKRIPRPTPPTGLERSMPANDVRAQKSKLLRTAGLYDFALDELEAAASGGAKWAVAEIVRVYQSTGLHSRAMGAVKRALPGYFTFDLGELPRPMWEALFPRLYWQDVKANAEENDLDPFLVAAIIRQESEFQPDAVSRAQAIGLMQLLPKTGRVVARQLKIRPYSTQRLTDPSLNLKLGTRYFRERLDEFGGTPEYALAGYNAGPDRVRQWLAKGAYGDIHEFVESIPFTETREYVQAIKRNVMVYRRLYGTP
ncbi:MAG: transglycosylase SLT domain-containing protein [Acidobacteria bacterium]|nr:transglycosylase SLT domain-containing protein [Acidobacteriota bacterium]